MQQTRSVVLWIVALIPTFAFVFTAAAQMAPPKLSASQWQADVRFLGEELPRRHKNAYHRMKREDFEAAVNQLYNAVPTMTDDEVIVGMMKLVAMVRDGHTSLIPRQFMTSGVYPIRLYKFSDGVYVQKAAPAYAEMAGAKVVRIGNVTIDEAMTAVATVVAADNEMGVLDLGPAILSVPEVLSGLKIVNDKQKLEMVVSKNGKERSFSIKPEGTIENLMNPPGEWADAFDKKNVPLYMTHQGDWYWFEYLKDNVRRCKSGRQTGDRPEKQRRRQQHAQ
jgi:hypothetical protein